MPSRRARLTLALGSSWYCSYTSTYGYVYTGGSGGGATKREFVAWSAERPGLEGGPRVSGERKAWSRIIFIPHSRLRGYVRITYHRCIIGVSSARDDTPPRGPPSQPMRDAAFSSFCVLSRLCAFSRCHCTIDACVVPMRVPVCGTDAQSHRGAPEFIRQMRCSRRIPRSFRAGKS